MRAIGSGEKRKFDVNHLNIRIKHVQKRKDRKNNQTKNNSTARIWEVTAHCSAKCVAPKIWIRFGTRITNERPHKSAHKHRYLHFAPDSNPNKTIQRYNSLYLNMLIPKSMDFCLKSRKLKNSTLNRKSE